MRDQADRGSSRNRICGFDSARDLEASAPAAVGADRSVDELAQPERLAELADARVGGLVIETPQTGVHGEVPPPGQRSVDGAALINNWGGSAPIPDFTISASPSSTSIVRGNAGNVSVTTTVSGGFNSAVSLSASGQPTGVTVAFSPSSMARVDLGRLLH
jgi:hypothetical protein